MRLAILCSGQAGQCRTMLDPVLAAPDCAELREVASSVIGRDVVAWWRGLDEAAIFSNMNAQLAIALYQLAAWQRLAACLPQPPVVVAGYSLGEVLAWHVAGALDMAETLRLVRTRARLMDACLDVSTPRGGCMALLRGRATPAMRQARAAALARHGVAIAIHRHGGDQVLAAPGPCLDALIADPAMASADLKRLPVEVPSHTAWLAGAVAPFAEALAACQPRMPRFPVIAGIDGTLQRHGTDSLTSLPRQIAEPVRWDWCLETLGAMRADLAIELGPGNDLARQLEQAIPDATARAMGEFARPEDVADWLARRA
ncbi:ACP S-malonyltransferase [Denitromonas iodatirespirans]|uniref:Acyltransferase domain-containing protein n=1 Tax=Denitromonas iodatirespirans TaxID=2795389 RepID=A0A944HDA3_DENI1|nr:acyltransferase domain-containing protein [Denitromonas iodatirespirans]MBT0961871.1 acyltransferase domain-containing protein [Denitromonas iodatirespirans]